MIIYPKTNECLGGLDALKPYIDKGIEIQFEQMQENVIKQIYSELFKE